jgi:heme exporter protein D
MKQTHIRRTIYHIRNTYLTMNNLVVVVAFLIAASWAWGSIGVVQKNYMLQGVVDDKKRQAKLAQLETDNLAYEQKYYQSAEYQELAVRERMGLALPGEKVLVLPPNSAEAKAVDANADAASSSDTFAHESKPSNLQQWANFLFGGSYSAGS